HFSLFTFHFFPHPFPYLSAIMLRIGITGGIGSGKSVVSHIFSVLGIPVFDADSAARHIMETDVQLRLLIKEAFGEEAYEGQQLNRKYLSSIVFSDPFKLEILNALVHPAAIAAADNWAGRQDAPYVVKEAALFFEAGSTAGIDYMIGVYAPKHIRIKRAMDRDGISREEVLSRMHRQIDEEIKMRLCDFVIHNDEQHMLIPRVLELHEKFCRQGNENNA
ncbi:MAG TPA: dephospho-CoA kinase, partial [Sediminibacterium sp.]